MKLDRVVDTQNPSEDLKKWLQFLEVNMIACLGHHGLLNVVHPSLKSVQTTKRDARQSRNNPKLISNEEPSKQPQGYIPRESLLTSSATKVSRRY